MLLTALALALLAGTATGTEPARNREQLLVTIVSEPEDNLVHEVALANGPDGFLEHVVRRSRQDQTVVKPEELSRGEVVLARTDGRDSVLLSCPGCDFRHEGVVSMRYISNGLFHRYAVFQMRLRRMDDGSYRLASMDGRRIERLRLTARRWLGILLGVKSVEIEN